MSGIIYNNRVYGDNDMCLTQAQYDELVRTDKVDPNTTYYITDDIGGFDASSILVDNSFGNGMISSDNVQGVLEEYGTNFNNIYNQLENFEVEVVDPMNATQTGSAADAYKTRQAIENMAIGGSASDITYDNSASQGAITATNVQDAIDQFGIGVLEAFQEVGNELSRIDASFSTAADAIGDALVAKGVSVPTGTSLSSMASLINSNLINASQANAIKNALTAKGISVPTNASLSDMATLITNNLAKALVSESKWVSIWAGGNRTYTGTVVFSQSFAKTPTVSFTWDAAKWSSVTASNIDTGGFTYHAVCNFWDGESAGFTWYARS